MEIKEIKDWGLNIVCERPIIMAGPCSAETEEQVLNTGRELKAQGISIFRAGIWKPRTRPNSFEGVGTQGLQWLKKLKEETGMLISTEVANEKHVFEAIKYGVDILWIGARTTANPFAVQSIAEALEGYDIPVLVKNPVNPDVELWIGAIERLSQAGITRIGAIHRGFSTFEKHLYRNKPQWQIPIELRQRIKNIPIICDPSHIGGDSQVIHEISQKALDLNFDGLIIESHINPKEAWSDAKQQLEPRELEAILRKLVLRDIKNSDFVNSELLIGLRDSIDKLDNKLFKLLGDRMLVAEKIGNYKKQHNITILQNDRWAKILETAFEKGQQFNLSQEFIEKLFKAIHQESINKQTVVMNR